MLTTFAERLSSKGVAQPNKYRIHFTGQGPSTAGGWDDAIGLMCESIEFPGQNFMSAPDALRYGPPRESVTGVTYAPITATFICNYQMYEKRWFEAWQNQCMDMNTWEPNYYKDYTGELKIYQLDRDNAATYVVELFEVYPKTIIAQQLQNSTNDSYHTLSVELMYHHWEYAAEETVSERNSPVIRMSAEVSISTAMKNKGKNIFSQALTAIGNYQDEKAKNPPAVGPPGRGYAPSQQAQENAKAEAAALKFIKGGMAKAAGTKGDPGTTFSSGDMASGLAGMTKSSTGMQGTMLSMLSGSANPGGIASRAGGMSVSLGAQFNMRMKTPNLARMRGSANALSMVPKVNASSKLKSMFGGGGGGMSFGGSKLGSSSGGGRRSVEGGASGDGAGDR